MTYLAMLEDINRIKQKATEFEINTNDDLKSYRLSFMARGGELKRLMVAFSSLSKEEKQVAGKAINELKKYILERFNDAKEKFSITSNEDTSTYDITLPPLQNIYGRLHPLRQGMQEIQDIFVLMGFRREEGPEIEDDFHNFTALNFPPNHPARDEQDTFFLDVLDEQKRKLLLRTHTSPTQIRMMKKKELPIRSIVIGRVYRNEAISYKSYCLFHQIEGLYVDKGVSMMDIKQSIDFFLKRFFSEKIQYRIRTSFFPFTEPSIEVDILWEKNGKKQWMEVMGAGMVHPNVFEYVEIDPENYTGFAFGMGLERLLMIRHNIDDIRLFYDNDIRFLNQF